MVQRLLKLLDMGIARQRCRKNYASSGHVENVFAAPFKQVCFMIVDDMLGSWRLQQLLQCYIGTLLLQLEFCRLCYVNV